MMVVHETFQDRDQPLLGLCNTTSTSTIFCICHMEMNLVREVYPSLWRHYHDHTLNRFDPDS